MYAISSSFGVFGSLRKPIDYFVTDDKDLCMFAYERGSLAKLSQVVNSITPTDRSPTWEEEESEHISSLREVSSCIPYSPLSLAHRVPIGGSQCNRSSVIVE